MSRAVTSGLDLAGLAGVAWGVPFERPSTTLWNIRHEDPGQRGIKLMRFLREHVNEVRPAKVFLEAPLEAHVAAHAGHSPMTTVCLNGYVFVAMTVLSSMGIPWQLYERQDVLQHFTGCRRYKLKNGAKEACVIRCKQLGWGNLSFDEADAAALWDCGNAKDDLRGYALAGVNRAVKISRKVLR